MLFRSNGLLLSFMLGAASIWLKSQAMGWPTPDADTPKGFLWWMRNGIDRSGAFGILHSANDLVGYATRGGLSAGRILGGDPDPSYRYGNRNWVSELVGPSYSTFQNAGRVSGGLADVLQGIAPSQASRHAFERMIPYNNLFYLSRAVRSAVGSAHRLGIEAFGLDRPRTTTERARMRRERAPGAYLSETSPGVRGS